jgi:hypothetical protein
MADCIHDIEEAWCATCNPPVYGPGPVDFANDVSQFIPATDNPADAISNAMLATVTGLSPSQVGQGIAWIRENIPDMPLISDRNGYRFTTDDDAVRRFRNTGARAALTMIRRRYRGALLPWLSTSGANTQQVHRLTRQFDRVMEDMADLIDA